MVDTIKFSEMPSAGNINNNDIMPSLRSGENVLLNNPWTFLPPGDTASRPTPSSTVNYRLRFNTEDQLYEYYDAVLGAWTQLQESAFTQGPFITYTASASLPDAQNLGALANGILKQSITLGVATLDIAVNGTDYWAPGDALTRTQVPTIGSDVTNKTYVDSVVAGAVVSVQGTANQVLVNGTSGAPVTGAITLTTPQDIASTSSPTFAALTLTSPLTGANGGSGVNNGSNTATFAGNLNFANSFQTIGNFSVIQRYSGATDVTFPTTGTLATTSQLPTGAALTKTDDTNVTLTLGGSPTVALLAATSLTLGWTGTLAETRGGTAQSTYALGDTLYASAANTLSKLAGNVTTAKQYLAQTGTGAVSAAPVWATIDGGDITGAALTKTDDTNVTLTLGGTPTTALLRAASLTLGWTGQLGLTRGGTAASLTASNGGLVYSTASALAILAAGSAGQIPRSGGAGAPSWSTATYPATAGTQYNALASDGTNFTSQTLTSLLDGAFGSAQGDILYRNASAWVVLAPGTSGQFLKTQGAAANPIWASGTVNGFTQVVSQVFTASATYTPTASMKYCIVIAVGAAAGSGGIASNNAACSGGGGGGGYTLKVFPAATIGASQSVTIGAAGTAGASGNNDGGTGGNTTFGALLTANGGVGGKGSAGGVTSDSAAGGAGGTASGGDVNIAGSAGGNGMSASLANTFGIAGQGGSSPLGLGAAGGSYSTGGGVKVPAAATGYGAGGGGVTNLTTATAGIAGTQGIVIVIEYL